MWNGNKQEEIEEMYDDISFIPNICSNKIQSDIFIEEIELKREKESKRRSKIR